MVGHGEMPVGVLDGLAVWRQFQAVIGGLHQFVVIPLTYCQFRGYHLQIEGGNGGGTGMAATGSASFPLREDL
jgi:hypothetical protein